jgi:hypothetical protein
MVKTRSQLPDKQSNSKLAPSKPKSKAKPRGKKSSESSALPEWTKLKKCKEIPGKLIIAIDLNGITYGLSVFKFPANKIKGTGPYRIEDTLVVLYLWLGRFFYHPVL